MTNKENNFFDNLVILFVEKAAKSLISFFVMAATIRHLGPDSYGAYSYAIAIVSIVAVFVNWGMEGLLVKELTKPRNKSVVIQWAFRVLAINSVTVTALMYFISFFMPGEITGEVILVSLSLLGAPYYVYKIHLDAVGRHSEYVRINLVVLGISSIARILGIVTDQNLTYFLIVFVIEAITPNAMLYLNHGKNNSCKRILSSRYCILKTKKNIRTLIYLLLYQLSIMLYMKVDQVMIKIMVDDKSLGIYSAAVKLTEVFYALPIILTTVLYPKIAAEYHSRTAEFPNTIRRYMFISIWTAMSFGIIVTIAGEYIVEVVFGKNFIQSAEILKIYCWGLLFVSIGVMNTRMYVLMKLEKHLAISSMISVFVNILLNINFYEIYGLVGFALASLAAQIFVTIIYGLTLRKVRRLLWFYIGSINLNSIKN
jgi:O-antigen/teichoic acid export membrane protein